MYRATSSRASTASVISSIIGTGTIPSWRCQCFVLGPGRTTKRAALSARQYGSSGPGTRLKSCNRFQALKSVSRGRDGIGEPCGARVFPPRCGGSDTILGEDPPKRGHDSVGNRTFVQVPRNISTAESSNAVGWPRVLSRNIGCACRVTASKTPMSAPSSPRARRKTPTSPAHKSTRCRRTDSATRARRTATGSWTSACTRRRRCDRSM